MRNYLFGLILILGLTNLANAKSSKLSKSVLKKEYTTHINFLIRLERDSKLTLEEIKSYSFLNYFKKFQNLSIISSAYSLELSNPSTNLCFFGGWTSTIQGNRCSSPWRVKNKKNVKQMGEVYDKTKSCGKKNLFRCNPTLFGKPNPDTFNDNDSITLEGVTIENPPKNKGVGLCINTGGSTKGLTEKCFKASQKNPGTDSVINALLNDPEKYKNFIKMSDEINTFCKLNPKYDACDWLKKQNSEIQEKMSCTKVCTEKCSDIIKECKSKYPKTVDYMCKKSCKDNSCKAYQKQFCLLKLTSTSTLEKTPSKVVDSESTPDKSTTCINELKPFKDTGDFVLDIEKIINPAQSTCVQKPFNPYKNEAVLSSFPDKVTEQDHKKFCINPARYLCSQQLKKKLGLGGFWSNVKKQRELAKTETGAQAYINESINATLNLEKMKKNLEDSIDENMAYLESISPNEITEQQENLLQLKLEIQNSAYFKDLITISDKDFTCYSLEKTNYVKLDGFSEIKFPKIYKNDFDLEYEKKVCHHYRYKAKKKSLYNTQKVKRAKAIFKGVKDRLVSRLSSEFGKDHPIIKNVRDVQLNLGKSFPFGNLDGPSTATYHSNMQVTLGVNGRPVFNTKKDQKHTINMAGFGAYISDDNMAMDGAFASVVAHEIGHMLGPDMVRSINRDDTEVLKPYLFKKLVNTCLPNEASAGTKNSTMEEATADLFNSLYLAQRMKETDGNFTENLKKLVMQSAHECEEYSPTTSKNELEDKRENNCDSHPLAEDSINRIFMGSSEVIKVMGCDKFNGSQTPWGKLPVRDCTKELR